ncbi:MAG: PucR family transcriptional regulator [Nocardioidaceae bacterium]
MSGLTVRDVLQVPVVRGADPQVVAGHDRLDEPVRWVHSTELADIAPLLRGGELVLSTGIALPEEPAALTEFANSLVDVGAAGLVIELGRRWSDRLPGALVEACQAASLPLVTLGREVRFAAVAQVLGERIVDAQLAELRTSERIHETFTRLSLDEAEPREILQAVQRLAGADVVVESEHHRVVDFVTGPGTDRLHEDWYDRSRRVVTADTTAWDPGNGWLLARIGRRDRGWGRLVIQVPDKPTHHLFVLAERAAAALALHRLHDRDRHNALRRTHHELLLALLADPGSPETQARCELAGLPMGRRRFVGLTVRPVVRADGPRAARASLVEEVLAAVLHAAHEGSVPALVCEVDGDVRALLSLGRGTDDRAVVDRLAAGIARRHEVVVGAGRSTDTAGGVDVTLRESQHVVASVPEHGAGRDVHRLEDTHLRGLLALLGDDERVRDFADRELVALRDRDDADALLATVRAVLDHPRSRTEASAALHLSRPAFYGRLAKVERVLGCSLDDPLTRTSLHVALLAGDVRQA